MFAVGEPLLLLALLVLVLVLVLVLLLLLPLLRLLLLVLFRCHQNEVFLMLALLPLLLLCFYLDGSKVKFFFDACLLSEPLLNLVQKFFLMLISVVF